jgi:antitoxin component YwqK of YwqJK toxin-antitoxin module
MKNHYHKIAGTLVCISLSMAVMAQRTQIKRGVQYTYYASDNLHFKGKLSGEMKEGKWVYYTDTIKTAQKVYQYFNYAADVLEGPFRKVSGDSIEIGTYATGKLNGPYTLEKFQLSVGGDTLKTPIKSGRYGMGKKMDFWKMHQNGVLHKEGFYSNDQKIKKWKTYDLLSKNRSNPDLMLVSNYEKDKKGGEEIRHFYYDEAGAKVNNSVKANYYQGKLNGTYEEKDATEKLIATGNYSEGKKQGEWTVDLADKNMTKTSNYFEDVQMGPVVFKDYGGNKLIEGAYDKNERNSTWSYFSSSGSKVKEENYKNGGKLNGEMIVYNNTEIQQQKIVFEDDVMQHLTRFDPNGSKVMGDYIFRYNDPAEGITTIEVKLANKDTVESFIYEGKQTEPFQYKDFEETFKNEAKSGRNFEKNGAYEKLLNDQVIESGYFTKNKKDGSWEYYYDSNVLWTISYENNEKKGEKFTDKKLKAPFKGNYLVKYPGGKTKVDIKVKDGLRNGKSIYYDKSGTVLREEKYKDGVK